MRDAIEKPGALYLEDLSVGQRFTSGEYRVDESGIKEFAVQFDPQPFHLDESYAQTSVFRGLAASGWHTAAATMRLLVTGGLPFAAGIIGLGGEIAWPRPTRPGDTLRVESEILEIVPSRSKPNQAIVSVRNITSNQNGEQVQVFTAKILSSSEQPSKPDKRVTLERMGRSVERRFSLRGHVPNPATCCHGLLGLLVRYCPTDSVWKRRRIE